MSVIPMALFSTFMQANNRHSTTEDNNCKTIYIITGTIFLSEA